VRAKKKTASQAVVAAMRGSSEVAGVRGSGEVVGVRGSGKVVVGVRLCCDPARS
jgi:hypothetical protein